MIEYRILSSTDTDILNRDIKVFIKAGYTIFSELQTHFNNNYGIRYIQPIVKYEQEEG